MNSPLVTSPQVVGVGEVLWDMLPQGPQLGGAPANFAFHAQALGARAAVISRVGDDPRGREILQRFSDLGLAGETVQVDAAAPTGTVTVDLSGDGVPQFIIHEGVAWDRLKSNEPAMAAARAANAICFGTLAQRTPGAQAAIHQLITAATAASLRVLDLNLRQRFYSRGLIERSLGLANVFKLNDGELATLAEMFGLGGTPRSQVESIAGRFNLRLVALTRGADGSLLYQSGRWSEQPPLKVEVADTVGAGDAFTAALVMGLLSGLNLDEVHAAAARIAAFVCTRPGATPALPEHLRRLPIGPRLSFAPQTYEPGASTHNDTANPLFVPPGGPPEILGRKENRLNER